MAAREHSYMPDDVLQYLRKTHPQDDHWEALPTMSIVDTLAREKERWQRFWNGLPEQGRGEIARAAHLEASQTYFAQKAEKNAAIVRELALVKKHIFYNCPTPAELEEYLITFAPNLEQTEWDEVFAVLEEKRQKEYAKMAEILSKETKSFDNVLQCLIDYGRWLSDGERQALLDWWLDNVAGFDLGYATVEAPELEPVAVPEMVVEEEPEPGDVPAEEMFERILPEFPASYHVQLRELHEKYPNWVFIPDRVNVDFEEFVVAQLEAKAKAAHPDSAYGDGTSFETERGYFNASKDAVYYFTDPRSMMTYGKGNQGEFERVMQFLYYKQENIPNESAELFLNRVTEDERLTNLFIKFSGNEISPIMLGAIYHQERGPNGEEYKGKIVYNLFNIGANTGRDDGLKRAFNEEWFSPEDCVKGSVPLLRDYKIGKNQETLYAFDWNYKQFQENNVVANQYAADVADAALKGIGLCQKVGLDTLKDYALVFKIPVYKNMPEEISIMPTK